MPAITIPMIWGILSFPMTIGAERMIRRTTKNTNVGSEIWRYEVKNIISVAKITKIKKKYYLCSQIA